MVPERLGKKVSSPKVGITFPVEEENLRSFKKKDVKTTEKQTLHHYVLAHVVLRKMVLGDPYGFFEVMGSLRRQDFLKSLWKHICQECDKDGPAFFTPRDIKVHLTRIGDYPALLIEMPVAHFQAEAHMVCVVLKVPLKEIATRPKNPQVGYLTLEKGEGILPGQDRTVLCAWDRGAHINYGNGPEATQVAFIERVRQMI